MDIKDEKKPRPAASYAILYPDLCKVARKLGYCLTLHGSMVNDLDIVAIPWVEDAVAPEELVEAIRAGIDGFTGWDTGKGRDKPHGRKGYLIWFKGVIDLPKGGRWCIDLSIMPRIEKD